MKKPVTTTALTHAFNDAAAELLLVDPAQPETVEMLKKAYQDIYMPAFPIEDERESLETILQRVANPDDLEYVVVLAGTNLKDPAKRKLQGLAVGGYFKERQTGLLAYTAADPSARGGGIGKKLLNARRDAIQALAAKNGQELKCLMLEVNNPARVKPEEDSIDPAVRLAIFEGWGMRVVPINYVLPPLEADQEKCADLMLMACPVEGRMPGKKAVLAYIESLYQTCLGPGFAKDPDFKAMKKQVEAWDGRFAAPKKSQKPSQPKPF